MSEASLEELVSAYLDDELSSAERQLLETELAQNPALQQLLESLRLQRQWFRALPRHSLPTDLSTRILELTKPLSTESLSTESLFPDSGTIESSTSETSDETSKTLELPATNFSLSGSASEPAVAQTPSTLTPAILTPAALTPDAQADRAASRAIDQTPRYAGGRHPADFRSWSLVAASLATVLLALIFWQNVPEYIRPLAGIGPSSRSANAPHSNENLEDSIAFKASPEADKDGQQGESENSGPIFDSVDMAAKSPPSPNQTIAESATEIAKGDTRVSSDSSKAAGRDRHLAGEGIAGKDLPGKDFTGEDNEAKQAMEIALGGLPPLGNVDKAAENNKSIAMRQGIDPQPISPGVDINPKRSEKNESDAAVAVVGIQNIWFVEIPNSSAQVTQLEKTLSSNFVAANSLNFRELETGKLEVLLVDIPRTELFQRLVEIGQSTEVIALEYDAAGPPSSDALQSAPQQTAIAPQQLSINAPNQLAQNMLDNSRANFFSQQSQASQSIVPNENRSGRELETISESGELAANQTPPSQSEIAKEIESRQNTLSPNDIAAATVQSTYLGQQSFLEAKKNFRLRDQQPIVEQMLDELAVQSRAIRRVDPQSANQSPQLAQAIGGGNFKPPASRQAPLPSKMGGDLLGQNNGGAGGAEFAGGGSGNGAEVAGGNESGQNSLNRGQTRAFPNAPGNLPVETVAQGPPANSQRVLLLIGRGIDPKSQLRSRADSTNLLVPQSNPPTNIDRSDK